MSTVLMICGLMKNQEDLHNMTCGWKFENWEACSQVKGETTTFGGAKGRVGAVNANSKRDADPCVFSRSRRLAEQHGGGRFQRGIACRTSRDSRASRQVKNRKTEQQRRRKNHQCSREPMIQGKDAIRQAKDFELRAATLEWMGGMP